MKDNEKKESVAENEEVQYSLNDDRRVKVLSPGAMVAKRFFRNRMAMVGMIVLIFMFLFSFVGGLITPYGEDQLFYRIDYMQKEYAAAIENKEFRFISAEGEDFSSIVRAKTQLAINQNSEEFEYGGVNYKLNKEDDDVYTVSLEDGTLIGAAYKMIFSTVDPDKVLDFETQIEGLKAFAHGESSFTASGVT